MSIRALPLYDTIAIILLTYLICYTQWPAMLATVIIGMIVLHCTRFGTNVYALSGAEVLFTHVEAMRTAAGDKAFALADLALHRAITRASGNVSVYSVGTLIEAALLTTFRLSSPARSFARSAGQPAHVSLPSPPRQPLWQLFRPHPPAPIA